MEDVAGAVRSLLEREGISQRTLAHRAGVSQATVSRAARGKPLARGHAQARLLAYMHEQRIVGTADPIFSAISEIWDGSDAHAAALAHLLRASRELWPNLRGVRHHRR